MTAPRHRVAAAILAAWFALWCVPGAPAPLDPPPAEAMHLADLLTPAPPAVIGTPVAAEPTATPAPEPTAAPAATLAAAAAAPAIPLLDPKGVKAYPCTPFGAAKITGYVKGGAGLSNFTADGTSVWVTEKLAAASYNIPMQSLVRVDGLDFTYRVADRGRLPNTHIDVLVDDYPTAYALTSTRQICVVRWGPPT